MSPKLKVLPVEVHVAALQFTRSQQAHSNICIPHMLAAAASSVKIGHTLEPLGHAAMALGCSFTGAGAQESIHVVTKLTNGIFHTSDVQPADDHPEELQREREGGMKRTEEEREGRQRKGGRDRRTRKGGERKRVRTERNA